MKRFQTNLSETLAACCCLSLTVASGNRSASMMQLFGKEVDGEAVTWIRQSVVKVIGENLVNLAPPAIIGGLSALTFALCSRLLPFYFPLHVELALSLSLPPPPSDSPSPGSTLTFTLFLLKYNIYLILFEFTQPYHLLCSAWL